MNTKHVALLGLALMSNAAFGGTIQVPATANPWLAGMDDGSTARRGDITPEESPVCVTNTVIEGYAVYVFSACGSVNHGVTLPFFSPNGENLISHYLGAENGIADITAPFTGLIGVFLGRDSPDETPAPQPLDFRTASSRDYLELAPALKQPFFIGDGLTSSGAVKQVIAPAGATRLLLGVMDEYYWADNQGTFTVQVTKLEKTSTDNAPSFTAENSAVARLFRSAAACSPSTPRPDFRLPRPLD